MTRSNKYRRQSTPQTKSDEALSLTEEEKMEEEMPRRRKSLRISQQREMSLDVFQDESKENVKQRRLRSRRQRSDAREEFSNFLNNMQNQIPTQTVIEQQVEATNAGESFLTQYVAYSCSIKHAITARSWSGSFQVKAMVTNDTLTCWRLSGTSLSLGDCYVFAVGQPGSYKYVTLQEKGKPFRFLSSTKHPTTIDIDKGEETSDKRTFYFKTEGSSGYLVLASNQQLAARLDKESGRVVADTYGELSDLWQLVY